MGVCSILARSPHTIVMYGTVEVPVLAIQMTFWLGGPKEAPQV